MKAIELSGLEGFKSLRVADVEMPKPAANQILIEVIAAGINFAELELTWGRYPALKPLPYVLGFEAAGIVAEIGSHVKNVKVGDLVTAIVSSGGYAEYATADAHIAIPIPSGISFAEASTIPVQGVSAYALLKFAAKPQAHETILVQAAAGGVGLYLVQLAKIIGVKRVIALASAREKLDLVKSLGADVAINYSDKSWPDQVRDATGRSGNPSGRPRKAQGIPELLGKITKQKVLTKGNNGLQRMTKLEASFTQLINQAAGGHLKALDLLAKMMICFPETVKPRDVEDKVSSAKVKLLELLEARYGSLPEGAAEPDQPLGQ